MKSGETTLVATVYFSRQPFPHCLVSDWHSYKKKFNAEFAEIKYGILPPEDFRDYLGMTANAIPN